MNKALQRLTSSLWLGEHYLSCHIIRWRHRLAEWKFERRWPNYCRQCNGWGGGTIYNYPHSPDDFDICEIEPETKCHRCGELGLTEDDSEGPCSFCGWDYDDGLFDDDGFCACHQRQDAAMRL